MQLSSQKVLVWLAAVLLFGLVNAQDSSPGGYVHPGQPSNCNGWHTVVSDDNCQNVPARYGITFAQFRAWNPAVSADCIQNFWLEAAYCVRVGTAPGTTTSTTTTSPPTATSNPNAPETSPGGPVHPGQSGNCNGWHTIVSGDNCQNVPERYGITFAQFLEWNPAVSSDCTQNFWLESAYCVRTGERPTSTTVPPSSITSDPGSSSSSWFNSTYSTQHPVTEWNVTSSRVDTAWPPTKTIEGQTELCNEWHLVSPGDTCQTILSRYGLLTLANFLDWNPSTEEDCEELIADYWVCVGIQNRNVNTDLEWATAQPEFTPPPEATEHTFVTEPTADSSFAPSPSHGPMPSNCRVFHQAEADQNCNDIVDSYGYISQEQFLEWNPALNGNCNGLWLDTWYCVGAFDDLPLPPHETSKPTSGNVPVGYPQDCARWYFTTVMDTCASIADMFGSFDEEDFITWNPRVTGSCGNIQQEAWYCVGRPATPTTRTEGAPEPTGTEDAMPTQSGIAADCSEYWLVGDEDTCGIIALEAGVSVSDLYLWNEVLEEPGCSGLEPDYYICVGVGEDDEEEDPVTLTSTATTSTTSATTTTTEGPGTPVETPWPVREGMAENCVRFYLQQPGDLCYYMADSAGISLSQFYDWNPAIGSDCLNLWPDYFYCIGVSGPATTITQGPPVPT